MLGHKYSSACKTGKQNLATNLVVHRVSAPSMNKYPAILVYTLMYSFTYIFNPPCNMRPYFFFLGNYLLIMKPSYHLKT